MIDRYRDLGDRGIAGPGRPGEDHPARPHRLPVPGRRDARSDLDGTDRCALGVSVVAEIAISVDEVPGERPGHPLDPNHPLDRPHRVVTGEHESDRPAVLEAESRSAPFGDEERRAICHSSRRDGELVVDLALGLDLALVGSGHDQLDHPGLELAQQIAQPHSPDPERRCPTETPGQAVDGWADQRPPVPGALEHEVDLHRL